MFIAMSGKQDLAPLGAKPGRQDGRAGKSDCAPTELQGKDRQAINISPLWGEATANDLLHFEVEFADEK